MCLDTVLEKKKKNNAENGLLLMGPLCFKNDQAKQQNLIFKSVFRWIDAKSSLFHKCNTLINLDNNIISNYTVAQMYFLEFEIINKEPV